MTHEYKICPSCREEYTLAAVECVSCEIPLVFPDDIEEGEPEDFPPISELECVRVGPLPWTRALSQALAEAGIAHRVERDTRSEEEGGVDPAKFGGETVYGTWVKPEQYDGAMEIDNAYFAHLEPEEELEAGLDDVCPACQEPLASDALECPSCSLSFG